MTNISRDNNSVTVIAGVLNSDGKTPTMVQADPVGHFVEVVDGSSGAVTASADARRDENSVTTMLVLSSDGLGTVVELAVDSSGNLLIQST